jgi:hypothetical protein
MTVRLGKSFPALRAAEAMLSADAAMELGSPSSNPTDRETSAGVTPELRSDGAVTRSVETAHCHRQKYLYGFTPIAEVLSHVRTRATRDEIDRLRELAAEWDAIRSDVEAVLAEESGLSETIEVRELPAEYLERATRLVSDPLLQRGLGRRHALALVEIDKLIAAQRRVNLDFVDRIAAQLPDEISLDFLIEFCLSPRPQGAPVQYLQSSRDTHVFSSSSTDLRFLGSFMRPLTGDDLEWAESGGIPVMAVVSFIGYGDAPINALWSGSRAILNNGYHRVYALRQRGVRHIPVILQFATDLALEFPSRVVDLPKDYLLSHPRPVLMKDFFEEKFTKVLRVKDRLGTVIFRSDVQQRDIPC